MRDRRLFRTIILGVVATAIGIVLGFAIHWFPSTSSTQASKIDTLYKVLLVACIPIFVLVVTVILHAVVYFRMKPGQEMEDGPPIHGNTRLEMIWTVLPAVLILGLVSYSFVVLHDIEKRPGGAEMQVNVTGQQFAWSYQYPSSVTGGAPVQSSQLYLPRGESVRFNMKSVDVIHAFWVPAFRIQQDVVPGVTTHYRITPTRLGTFDVVCNELCGLGHSVMRSTVHVVSPADFQTWLRSKQSAGAGGAAASGAGLAATAGAATSGNQAAQGASPAAGGSSGPPANPQLVAAGKQTFTGDGGCGSCHTLADAATSGQIGPNLDRVLKGNKHAAAFIRTSIVSPNAYIETGYPPNVMPGNFGSTLSAKQIDALVAYLQSATKP